MALTVKRKPLRKPAKGYLSSKAKILASKDFSRKDRSNLRFLGSGSFVSTRALSAKFVVKDPEPLSEKLGSVRATAKEEDRAHKKAAYITPVARKAFTQLVFNPREGTYTHVHVFERAKPLSSRNSIAKAFPGILRAIKRAATRKMFLDAKVSNFGRVGRKLLLLDTGEIHELKHDTHEEVILSELNILMNSIEDHHKLTPDDKKALEARLHENVAKAFGPKVLAEFKRQG